MSKIKVIKEGYDFESDESFEAEVKKFGTGSAHIIVPKKWIDRKVVIFFKTIVKQWTGGYVRAGRKGISAEQFSKEVEKGFKK
jgi:putative transposon-encoded protein